MGEPSWKPGPLQGDLLFHSKEDPLTLPGKDGQGGFQSPPADAPLQLTREGPAGPSLGFLPELEGGSGSGGRWGNEGWETGLPAPAWAAGKRLAIRGTGYCDRTPERKSFGQFLWTHVDTGASLRGRQYLQKE